MNVKTANGKIVEVVLNPDTKIEKPEGIAGFRKKRLDVTALTPGLSVAVQGMQYENDQLVAKIVIVSRHSLQSGNAVLPAASPGPQDTNLADYSVKAAYDAHFEAGSALLSQSDKTGLMHLANNATELSAYIIQVQGFADVPGNNAYDQQLSRDRAEAVIDYLERPGVFLSHTSLLLEFWERKPQRLRRNRPEAIRRTGARRSSCCCPRTQPITERLK